ncbi:MAG: pilus assembly protein TadG-related protein [Steroidobacterales bacterium]
MQQRSKQRGITLVVIAVAMLALLAMAGLAIDIGRLVGDKARLQAAVDAAALAAAKVVDTTGSTVTATAAANNVFAINVAAQPDLAAALGTITVNYSNTVGPFVAGSAPPLYAQVIATGFSVAATFSSVLGFNTFALNASATAGASPTLSNACNQTPMMVCGAPASGAAPVYGFAVGQITALQLSAGTSPVTLAPPGYFLQQSSGVNSQDQDFAGGYAACNTVGTGEPAQTGTLPAPVAQGLDTRFNEYTTGDVNSGSYPPDAIITQPTGGNRLMCTTPACTTIQTVAGAVITNSSQYGAFSYEGMYQPRLAAANYDIPPAPNGNGMVDRRVLAVPVGDCTGAAPGGNSVPVLGLACMFMLQDVDPVAGQVFAEVVQSCEVNGTPGPGPNNGPGPYSIQLYHVFGSPQS